MTEAVVFEAWRLEDVEQSIVARFETIVRRYPARLAVKSGNDSWTYHELDERANSIASALLSKTGSSNDPVAILFDQGASVAAAIVGALKAGKIYVPLDPHDAPARLLTIIEDSSPVAVLCDSSNLALARAIAGGKPVIAHTGERAQTESPGGHPDVTPDTLAYIYYTSGSTGTPKGVVDNHRNVLHNILRYTNNLRITAEDRLTLIQSPAFSGSVSSFFSAILNGGASYPFDIRRHGPARLSRLMMDEAITIYHSVPSIFREVARHADTYPAVRVVRLEGDRAAMRDIEIFRRHFAGTCELAIGLGATETGLSCQHIMRDEASLSPDRVLIGKPPADMFLRVVNDDGNEVGSGVEGELVVRSRFLAVGYWHRPDLAHSAFATRANGMRDYRTGDVCRKFEDGQLEYIGRKDHRLRIAGNVVEPAAVEQAILGAQLASEAIVGSRDDPSGRARVVAWLVPVNGLAPSVTDVRRVLTSKLPASMIPSRVVTLEALPVSANGKVDRRQLPDPWDRIDAGATSRPTTDLEHIVAGIWRRALGLGQIGIDDDFFEAGGDSLSAVQIAIEIEESLGRIAVPTDIFTAPTIRALARALEKDAGTRRDSSLVCLQPRGDMPPLFLLHPASGDVFFYRTLADALGPGRPVYAIESATSYESGSVTLEKLAKRYIQHVKSIQPDGPYHLAGFCFGASVALEMAHQLEENGESVGALIVLDTDEEDVLVRSAADAIGIHVRRMRVMSARQRARYVVERARYRSDRLRVRVLSSIARLRNSTSPSVRRALLRDVHSRARDRHSPMPCRSPISCIHPADRVGVNPLSFWGAMSSAGAQVVVVGAPHAEMFREAHVPEIAAAVGVLLRS